MTHTGLNVSFAWAGPISGPCFVGTGRAAGKAVPMPVAHRLPHSRGQPPYRKGGSSKLRNLRECRDGN